MARRVTRLAPSSDPVPMVENVRRASLAEAFLQEVRGAMPNPFRETTLPIL